jgi:hypothetical protein
MIGEHDTAAVEVVDSLEDVFIDDPQNYEALRKLAQSVMAYDFESAALQFDSLANRIESLPSEEPR